MAFSLTRTWYLFKLQWIENRKLYTLGILALIGIMVAVFVTSSGSPSAQSMIFEFGMFISSSIFTSSILSQFSDKIKSVNALMLPASALEKTVVALIYSMLLFPVLYIVFIYPAMLLGHYYHADINGDLDPLYDYGDNQHIPLEIALFFVLQAFVLFCSVMFRRYTYIKTVVLVCTIIFCLFSIDEQISDGLFKGIDPKILPKDYIPVWDTVTVSTTTTTEAPKGSKLPPNITYIAPHKEVWHTRQFNLAGGDPYGDISFMTYREGPSPDRWCAKLPANQQLIFIMLLILIPPFFWLLTWLRLREKTLIA
jgi:hypothetical protein